MVKHLFKKKQVLYQGQNKNIFSTNHPDILLISCKKDLKKDAMLHRFYIIRRLSELLKRNNIKHYYIQHKNPQEFLAEKLEMFPFEIIIQNYASNNLAQRLGIKYGQKLIHPVLEYHSKNCKLPSLLNNYHILTMSWAKKADLEQLEKLSFRINDIISNFLYGRKIILLSLKLEFGLLNGEIVLATELSPDNWHFSLEPTEINCCNDSPPYEYYRQLWQYLDA